jgi:hypothetical protein
MGLDREREREECVGGCTERDTHKPQEKEQWGKEKKRAK